jgi:hypothetical protein
LDFPNPLLVIFPKNSLQQFIELEFEVVIIFLISVFRLVASKRKTKYNPDILL